jgi:hypothetical protein
MAVGAVVGWTGGAIGVIGSIGKDGVVAMVGGNEPRMGAGVVTSSAGVMLLPVGGARTDLLMLLGNGLVMIGAPVLIPAADGVTIGI